MNLTALKSLEHLDSLSPHVKASILLVSGALKPTAMFYIEGESFVQTDAQKHVDENTINEIKSTLIDLGLSVKEWTWIDEDPDNQGGDHKREYVQFFISNNADKATQLHKLVTEDWKGNTEAIGLLLGYPETAVKAFAADDDTQLLQTNPKNAPGVSTDNLRLLGFRLSKQNWQNEALILERYGVYLKKVSPLIYKACI